MLDISDSRISTFVSISLWYRYTADEQNATSPPHIVLEVLLATDWLWLRLTPGNIQWLHRSHQPSAIIELKGSTPVCHALEELQQWQVHDQAQGLPEVRWVHWCGDESHGSALKWDQEADAWLISKKVRWLDDGDIQRKENVFELQTAKVEAGETTDR